MSDQGRDDPTWQVVRERERYRAATYAPWLRAGYRPPAAGMVPLDQTHMVGSARELIAQIEALTRDLPLTDLSSWATSDYFFSRMACTRAVV